jgi:hypothetical protein
MARFLQWKLTLILLAFACGAVLVACVLRGDLPPAFLGPAVLSLLALRYKHRGSAASLFADGLLTSFGLSLACLPVLGLQWLASQENIERTPHFDLSQLESSQARLPPYRKFQLDGAVYFAYRERVYTKNYGWVVTIYSRLHPRFPGHHRLNRGTPPPLPQAVCFSILGKTPVSDRASSPSFFVQLDHCSLERLAHRYLPPPAGDEIRYQVCLRQSREGWLQEMPGDLYVLPCQQRAQTLSLSGAALFALGLSLLIANLGSQHRARTHISRWDRPL